MRTGRGSSQPPCAAFTLRCHRLTDVAPAAARSVGGSRPQREVVGKGGQRSHVHEVVSQQTITSTQRVVDLRQEEVSAVRREPQSFHHVVDLETINRRVVVSADTKYVSVQSIISVKWRLI